MIIEIKDMPPGRIANITIEIKFEDGNPQVSSKISNFESLSELKESLFTEENLNELDKEKADEIDYEKIFDKCSDEIEKDKPEIPPEMLDGQF